MPPPEHGGAADGRLARIDLTLRRGLLMLDQTCVTMGYASNHGSPSKSIQRNTTVRKVAELTNKKPLLDQQVSQNSYTHESNDGSNA